MDKSRFTEVGPDTVGITVEDCPPGTTWAVTWYKSGSYEGSGTAYCGDDAGKVFTRNLGHCSCYGPLDHEAGSWDELDEGDLNMRITGNDHESVSIRMAIASASKKPT